MAVLKARISGAWVPVGGGPSGGGTDEVVISATEPPLAETELWYDTSVTATLTNDTRWNTAWGIVAMGSMLDISTVQPGTTTITNPINFTSIVGRYYRLCYQIRVIGTTTGNGIQLTWTGSGVDIGGTDTWQSVPTGPYSYFTGSLVFDGTGVASSYTMRAYVTGATGVWLSPYTASYFYMEDMGPVVGAAPTLPSGVQMMVGAGAYQTDANGDATINLPVGTKLTAAVANGSQSVYPMHITANMDDGPVGGNKAMFRVRNLSTTAPATSTWIGLSYMITYTY